MELHPLKMGISRGLQTSGTCSPFDRCLVRETCEHAGIVLARSSSGWVRPSSRRSRYDSTAAWRVTHRYCAQAPQACKTPRRLSAMSRDFPASLDGSAADDDNDGLWHLCRFIHATADCHTDGTPVAGKCLIRLLPASRAGMRDHQRHQHHSSFALMLSSQANTAI